jgi:hypothetical protein
MGDIVEGNCMSQEISGIELLAAAIGWYQSNGAVTIPEAGLLSGTRVRASAYHDTFHFDLESNKRSGIHHVPGNVYPVLAGIALGFDSVTLAKIIKEHMMSLEQLYELDFNNKATTLIQLFEKQNAPVTPNHIYIEIFKAFAADPFLRPTIHGFFDRSQEPKECIAIMHTEERDLWPASRIEKHARLLMTPSDTEITNEFAPFENLALRITQTSDLPNQNPIDFLKRSGMLSEAVLRKQTGFFPLWEDLLHGATVAKQPLQVEMLKAFTNVNDKETLDLIIRGLRSTASEMYDYDLDAEDVFNHLSEVFYEHPALSKLANNIVFKLSLAPLQWSIEEPEEVETTNFFYDLVNCQETLLSRVAHDLLARPAEHLGYGDYNVFTKLTNMNLPPQVIDFEPERLVHHILDSISTYKSQNEVICEFKIGVDRWAMHNLEVMAKLLMRDHQFDFSQFNHRDDDMKVALIKAGFGIDLKTISRKARGQVLEDGLGL